MQAFIYDNMFEINDHAFIRCYSNGERILQADLNLQCNPPPWLLLPIDILNILLLIFLIIIFGDFIYNYYQYRRHGKLPWIVRNCKFC